VSNSLVIVVGQGESSGAINLPHQGHWHEGAGCRGTGATLGRTSQPYRALGQVPVLQDLLHSPSSGAGGRRRRFLCVSNRSSRRRRSTGAASPWASGLSRSVAESYTKLPPCGVQAGTGGGAAMRRTPEFKHAAGCGTGRAAPAMAAKRSNPRAASPTIAILRHLPSHHSETNSTRISAQESRVIANHVCFRCQGRAAKPRVPRTWPENGAGTPTRGTNFHEFS
jgi:hypothetical protein